MATTATTIPARHAGAGLLVGLIFLIVLLNYVDRGAIAIAAPLLKPELGLSATQFGIAVSAFFWVYAPIQLGIGWAIDRWCVYRLLAAGVAIWALSTFFTAFIGGLALLVALRAGLGLGEAFTFPAANKVIARHVPPERRGMANAAVAMGIALGPALGTFAGGMIAVRYGWRPIFLVFGAVTLFWLLPWLFAARSLPSFRASGREQPVAVAKVARLPVVWFMGLLHFAATYPLYFALTWFPLYLVRNGQPIEQMTWILTIGFLAQGAAAFAVGWASDAWTRSGRDEGQFRRWSMVLANLVIMATIILLIWARNDSSLILLMVALGIANATGGVNLYAVAQMFTGPRGAGSWVGVQNGIGNLSGIVGPIATGMIIDASGSYDTAFWVTAGVALAGAVGWIFLPPIRQIALDRG